MDEKNGRMDEWMKKRWKDGRMDEIKMEGWKDG